MEPSKEGFKYWTGGSAASWLDATTECNATGGGRIATPKTKMLKDVFDSPEIRQNVPSFAPDLRLQILTQLAGSSESTAPLANSSRRLVLSSAAACARCGSSDGASLQAIHRPFSGSGISSSQIAILRSIGF